MHRFMINRLMISSLHVEIPIMSLKLSRLWYGGTELSSLNCCGSQQNDAIMINFHKHAHRAAAATVTLNVYHNQSVPNMWQIDTFKGNVIIGFNPPNIPAHSQILGTILKPCLHGGMHM